MKKQYTKPTIKSEVLLKEDVLRVSAETDNNYVGYKDIHHDKATLEDLL